MTSFRRVGNFAASIYCAAVALFVLAASGTTPVFGADVSQYPLQVSDVAGNVALSLSVEFPTAVSVAHQGNFNATNRYVGYFDPAKCYRYHHGDAAQDAANTGDNVSYFYAVAKTTAPFKCVDVSDSWSGNFLNWMTMQAVDPFRWAMTGGYRRVDTADGLTVLERAWSPTILESGGDNRLGSDDNFRPIPYSDGDPLRRRESPSTTDIADHTPMSFAGLRVSVRTRGNQILFSDATTGLTNFNPGNNVVPDATIAHHTEGVTPLASTVYRFYARVKVCDPTISLEANCEQYGTHYKPEGLIQDYARRLRFSAVSYLNDPTDNQRDGGVLRARQKFVGPDIMVPGAVATSNPNYEWDEDTGVLRTNPDADDASATAGTYGVTVANSGVINYINKFGQEYHTYKRHDPVGELYYTTLRYLKGSQGGTLGNVPAWMPVNNESNEARLIDGFPVIATWDDPIQYNCQRNYIVGIGDTNSATDQNVPGPSSDGNMSKPAAINNDPVNTLEMRDKAAALNGGLQLGAPSSGTIVGLAYHAATQDIRPDLPNRNDQPRGQNVQTYWLDVLEFSQYRANNQFYLATKYGGLKIPSTVTTFNPLTATAADIPESWWRTTTDEVFGQPRPDNFYTVANPQAMVDGLRKTFLSISSDRVGSASAVAASSTRLDTDTRTFQAQFKPGVWSGEVNAYEVDGAGNLTTPALWNATEDMLTTVGTWNNRKILVNTDTDVELESFEWDNLNLAQTGKLTKTVVDYLRGDRSKEENFTNGTLRVRTSILGDIINSTPLFVGAPNPALHAGAGYAGGEDYADWAAVDSARGTRTPVLYVGANDGMLHAFNANNGAEIFAFVPNAVIQKGLIPYSSPLYEHQYYVDGETAAAEIYDATSESWRTVLVGSMGRGGAGLFALDVTVPESPELLWELDGDDIEELGHNIGRPVIAQVASGDWRVILGNGPDSGAGAYMITVGLGGARNGVVTTVGVGAMPSTNGMTSLLVRDSDLDSFADMAYAGDLDGGLWRITGIATGSPSALKLFQTADPLNAPQPITAAPVAARDPATGRVWVFFGTGSYLNEDDISDKQVQTWYGIMDTGTTATRGDLVDRDILVETTVAGLPARVIEEASVGEAMGRGWFIDLVQPPTNLAQGERMVVQNRFQGSALVGTTRIPDFTDKCNPGGTGWVMAINPFTGARLANNFFDMSGNTISDRADQYCVGDVCVPVSGVGFKNSPSNPIFIDNVMQVGLADGSTDTLVTFASSANTSRLSWRELFNN